MEFIRLDDAPQKPDCTSGLESFVVVVVVVTSFESRTIEDLSSFPPLPPSIRVTVGSSMEEAWAAVDGDDMLGGDVVGEAACVRMSS